MATVGTLSKTRLYAAGSPRRHPQLLPHQGTLRSSGSHQRQHQDSSEKGSWLQESRLSAAQGPTHGGHQDRIHRSSESRLTCGSLRILVQSPKYKPARFHILLAVHLLANPEQLPKYMNSRDMEVYCKPIQDLLWDS